MHSKLRNRILIVSKPDTDCKSLYDILKEYGMVDMACNGQRAMEKIAGHKYDLIVSESSMPLMDGMELYKEAVALDPGLKNRFLFLTGSLARYYLKFFAANDIPFLFRPLNLRHLKEVVEEILNSTCCI